MPTVGQIDEAVPINAPPSRALTNGVFKDIVQNLEALFSDVEEARTNVLDLGAIGEGKGVDRVANAVKRVENIAALLAVAAPTRKTRVVVDGYYTPGDGGGGQFYWDSTATAFNDGGLIFNGWARVVDDALTIRQFGCVPGAVTPYQMRTLMQSAWTTCALTRIHLRHTPGDYELAAATNQGWLLITPNKFSAHADAGFKVINKSFALQPATPFRQRCIAFGEEANPRDNVRLTGTWEVDGGGADVPWYSEHNHCFMFMRGRGVYVEELIASNAMGDGVYFSGYNGTLSDSVRVDVVRAGSARRKSLVIEQTTNLDIGVAYLDNGLNGCFDYEPFSFGVLPLGARIGAMYCLSPIDLTTTNPGQLLLAQNNAILEVGLLSICPPAMSDAFRVMDFLGGINMKVGNLYIDCRKVAGTYPGPILRAYNPCLLTVAGDIDIFLPDGYQGEAIQTTAPGTIQGIPEISASRIRIMGNSVLRISNDCGHIRADEIVFEAVLADGLKPVQASTHIHNRATTSVAPTGIDAGVVKVINSRARSVIDSHNAFSHKPSVRIGAVRTVDTTTDVPLGAVISARPVYGAFASGAAGDLSVINSISYTGQAPTALFVTESGGVRVYRTSGSFDTASAFYLETAATTTPTGIRAKAGSTLQTSSGLMFIKSVDAVTADTSLGWLKVTAA